MTETTERNRNESESTEMVRISAVSKAYGTQTALEGVTLSFTKGGIHGILGPEGAGKSTLMDILSGSIAPDGGYVTVNGDALSPTDWSKRAKIGYLQSPPAFCGDMTVSEVLDFIGETRDVPTERRYRQIKEALDLCGLESVQNRLCRRLTGAELRRLGLAGALLGNPDVLLLDEPIQGTAEQSEELYELIRMLGRLKTVILATSNFQVIKELCSDVAILSEGRVLVFDTLADLEKKLLGSRALTVGTRGDANAIVRTVEAIAGVIACDVARNGRTGELRLRVEYRAEGDIREAVSAALATLGAPILSMSVSALSLEEVYTSLVAVSVKTKVPTSDQTPKKTKKRFGKRADKNGKEAGQ